MESCRHCALLLSTLLVLLAFVNVVAAQDIEAAVLGDPARWALPPKDPVRLKPTTDESKRPAWVAAADSTTISAAQPITGDAQLVCRLRMARPQGRGSYVTLGVGGVTLSLGAAPAPALPIQWSVALAGDPKANRNGQYVVKRPPQSTTGWPAMATARVEHDLAMTPSLDEKWLTVRVVLRADRAEVYVHDRLFAIPRSALVRGDGAVRLTMSDGVQLAALRIEPAAAEEARFLPVVLDGYLNQSNLIAGNALAADALPRGKAVPLGGIPLLMPRPDDRGNDHVSLRPSWLRGGLIEGAHDGWEGDTARWIGVLNRDPARIQFRVANGRYSRLHLLAAFDGEPDSTAVVTAQFYRPSAGHPVNFTGRVPLFTADASDLQRMPVTLSDGAKGNLYLVTIPIEPEGLDALADLDCLEFELTKQTRIYRAFPDPIYYSNHAAGLPSGVHLYAITLERPPVEVDFQPDQFAHIWTAPAKPSYSVRLHNNTPQEQEVRLDLATRSHDGTETTSQQKSARLAAGANETVKFTIDLKRYGYHEVKLQVTDSQGTQTRTRSLAHLHPDTRERGDWAEGKGPLWGMWDWNGGHDTPAGIPRLEVATALGIESAMRPIVEKQFPPEELAYAEQHGMRTHFLAYQFTPSAKEHIGAAFDATKPDEMKAAVVAAIKKSPMATPTKTNVPELAVFYGEPLLGPVSYHSFPETYGDPPYVLSDAEQKAYRKFHDEFVIAASAIKKEWPNAKCLLPWGIPSFPIPFLRQSKEATALMDGPAVDQVLFERLPEMQMHQVTFASCLWQLKQEWMNAGKPWPTPLISIEGGGLPSPATPGALTQDEEAEHSVRGEILLAAFGVTRHLGWPSLFRCAGAWGETHYGGGLCERLPLLSPKVAFSAHATMTRQLNGMNYVKTVETGSTSVFCLQFKHYKTGELLHVLWTLRGKRPVTLQPSTGITADDLMDNPIATSPLIVTTAPCFVRGLKEDAKITLGEPDHSDSKPAAVAQRLASLGDGSWKISDERDADYESAHAEFVKKFQSRMTARPVDAPTAQGDKALAVHLEKPEKERRTMPFYTTLVPPKPIGIVGKASHLGLWVRAASDWGRVVYFLRDANGERWISVGKKDEWNVDDVHCWSAFCFDGWRYLRFELPANSPYDCFREMGTSFWGYYGSGGNGIVDLPLTLEKIVIERRTHVIKADELVPADASDVLLADLYAEYEAPQDQSDEAVRLSRLRMSTQSATTAPTTREGGMGTPFK